MKGKTVIQILLTFALALFVAPASAQESAPAYLRVVHASADAPAVDVALNGAVIASGVTFGQATDYFALAAGDYTVSLTPTGEATAALETTLTLETGGSVTAVAMGAASALELQTFNDDLAPLELGMGRLVVINAAAGLETVDILDAEGVTLIGGVGQRKASSPAELAADAYDLDIIATGGDGTALPGSGMLYVNTGTLHTIVVLDGGSLALAAPAVAAVEPAATLRVGHASPDAPPVDVYLNDVKAVSALAFGSATVPIALAPGDYTVAFYIAGADPAEGAVTAAAFALAAGDARTLLAMNNVAALQLVLFAEDVSAPTAGNARLTAIHAVPDAPAVNVVIPPGTAVIENLAFGQQSAGVELPPGPYDATLADASTGEALLQLGRLELTAGRAYTAVVIPSAGGAQVVEPLVFAAMPTGPMDLTLAAAPEAPAEVAAETTQATPQPTATPLTPAVAGGPIIGTVITDAGFNLTVRRGPGPSYDPQPIRGLPSGYQVEVAGRDNSNQWIYIRATGEIAIEGWVSANWLEVTRGGQPVVISELPLAIGGEETESTSEGAGVSAPASGGATFTVSDLHYSEDGRQAFMMVNVTNLSLQPALASGNWYPERNPDGGLRWVTLFKSSEGEDVLVPIIDGNAPLWEFIVTLDTGRQFRAYAGCEYYNEIVGVGFEPTAQGGFTWTQILEGGWFRCGRDYDGSPKPPNDLLPGESYSVPLNVWLVNPHVYIEPGTYIGRIVRLDFIPKAPDGTSFGVQASVTLQ